MTAETAVAGVLVGSLVLYALGGGADFGGGVWDLLSFGPRAARQRQTITHAIGPIWEANHVWLILAVVLLFTCFPAAFARIGTYLHVPLTILLIGIVLRGSAFAFRSYGDESDVMQARWGRVFAVASVVSPIMLGVTLGAIASGRLSGYPDFIRTWLGQFQFVVGLLALAMFAYLAAVYLTLETRDVELQDDFRRRALVSWVAVAGLAILTLALSRDEAPTIFAGLTSRPWLLSGTAAVALLALARLWRRRFAGARVLAALQVALTVTGWGLAQYPAIVAPDLTIADAAAPPAVIRAVAGALAVGAVLLFPALIYLYRVFKGSKAAKG